MASVKSARSASEVNRQIVWARAWEEQGQTALPGKTFEEGVAAALEWMIGELDEQPIEESCEEEED